MTSRRYFDRTPFDDGEVSVGEVTNIINQYVVNSPPGIDPDSAEIQAIYDAIAEVDASVSSRPADRGQTLSAVAGDNVIDLGRGHFVSVVGTDGAWTARFTNIPETGGVVILAIEVTNDDDEVTIPNSTWYGTAPVTADYDAGDYMVLRLTRPPLTGQWVAEWLLDAVAPADDPTVTPPTLTAQYSDNVNRTGLASLGGATVSGDVAVVFGPASDDIASVRVFCDHSGALPAVGQEGDSFVRSDTLYPFDLIGQDAGGSAILWDTSTDPTGNNRSSSAGNGDRDFTVEATLIDGQTVEATFTVTVSNSAPGSSPTVTYSSATYESGTAEHTVEIPAGADRAVVVLVHYVANLVENLDTLMLGTNLTNDVPMTELSGAVLDPAGSGELLGAFAACMNENDLQTNGLIAAGVGGTLRLRPVQSSAPGAWSRMVYHVWTLTNVATPTFSADGVYDTSGGSLVTSVASVDANSIVVGAAADQDDGQTITSTLGTVEDALTTVTTNVAHEFVSRAMTLNDSGAAGSVSSTWGMSAADALAQLVSVEFASSAGGSDDVQVVPGVPSVSLTTPADNQIVATWSDTVDAVSYEIRWATTNPPNRAPVAAVSPRTINGLAASVVQYVQVRAVSSTGDRSAWSSVQSATPTGAVDPPPPVSGRLLAADNVFDATCVSGPQNYRIRDRNGVWVPDGWSRRNPASTVTGISSIPDKEWQNAISNWQSNSGRPELVGGFKGDAGPRALLKTKWTPYAQFTTRRPNHNGNGIKSEIVANVLAQASVASTGIVTTWQQMHRDFFMRTLDVVDGFRGDEVFMVSLAHESHGPWFPEYMGRDTSLIGVPEFLNATSRDYGIEVRDALVRIGTTGDKDDLHRLVVNALIRMAREINPNLPVGMTLGTGGMEQLEEPAPGVSRGTAVIDRAMPTEDMDFVFWSMYNRSPNAYTYSGSGDRADPDNWEFGGRVGVSNWYPQVAQVMNRYNCVGGSTEWGVSFNLPPTADVATNGAPSDEQIYVHYEGLKRLMEDTAAFPAGLGYVNHWMSGVQAPQQNAGAGKSFSIREGMWGGLPDNASFPVSLTQRPSWSSVAAGRYDQIVDWYTELYGPGAVGRG